jgi:hypothetical protein
MSDRVTVSVVWVLSVLAAAPGAAHAADPVKEKLNAAKAEYEAAIEKYRAAACDWFDQRERAARAKGDKKAVDRVKEDREAFEVKDELPDTALPTLKRLLPNAQADMRVAYKAAVAEYTRDKKDAEAAAVEKELDRFQKNETADKRDPLQPGTVWAGAAQAGTLGKVTRPGKDQTLTILERHGERFKGRYVVSSETTRIINGHIKGRRVWWTPDDVTLEKGSSKGADNFGYINGKLIRLRYVGSDKGTVGFGVSEFRLVDDK